MSWMASLRSALNRPKELAPLEAYALWADSYSPEPTNEFMRIEQSAMLEILPELRHKTILDLACGSGRYTRIVQGAGAAHTFGVDFSPPMLKKALQVTDKLVQADIRHIPLASDHFDGVICALALGHVEELKTAIKETSRVLKRGGWLLYSDIHPFGQIAGWKRNFHGNDGREYIVKNHFHLLSDHHDACLSADLSIQAVREPLINVDHPWRGSPAVLVILARKER